MKGRKNARREPARKEKEPGCFLLLTVGYKMRSRFKDYS